MNTHTVKFGSALSAVVIASGMLLNGAQAQDSRSIGRANVPFAFEYNHHTFHPGLYSIRLESSSVMLISNGRDTALGLVQRADTTGQPRTGKLVFRHTGDEYALQDVWLPQANLHLHRTLPKEPRRRELVQVTPNAPSSEVELALAEIPR